MSDISYELGLELKRAGFPQDGGGYISCGCEDIIAERLEELPSLEVFDCGRERVYKPTLEELIEEMEEPMSKLQEVAKKQGANEFKQKILDAFTRFLGANNEKLITISEVQTIISNLEV